MPGLYPTYLYSMIKKQDLDGDGNIDFNEFVIANPIPKKDGNIKEDNQKSEL